MANANRDNRDNEWIDRANRDDDQHVVRREFETIEGGLSDRVRREKTEINHDYTKDNRDTANSEVVGADYTRDPFDPNLRSENQGTLEDRTRGYGEPRPESNYPEPFNRDELINTDLNPAAVVPVRSTTGTFRVLAIVLAVVLFALLIAAMYWGWLKPVPRSPQRNGAISTPGTLQTAVLQPSELASF